jgi:hypothetical protein
VRDWTQRAGQAEESAGGDLFTLVLEKRRRGVAPDRRLERQNALFLNVVLRLNKPPDGWGCVSLILRVAAVWRFMKPLGRILERLLPGSKMIDNIDALRGFEKTLFFAPRLPGNQPAKYRLTWPQISSNLFYPFSFFPDTTDRWCRPPLPIRHSF